VYKRYTAAGWEGKDEFVSVGADTNHITKEKEGIQPFTDLGR
jgi:hypothetical protein